MDWHQIKVWLSATTGLSMDALHVHAGVICLVAVALLLRRRLSSPWPWLVVAVVVLINEVYDYRYEIWPVREMQRDEAVRDIWNTLLLPTLILLLARFTPSLFREPVEAEPSAPDPG